MNLTDFIPQIAQLIGIQPSQLLFWLGFITFLANTTARLIPQDAVGWKGTVRSIAAVIGVYVPSRVSGNISVTDVAKSVIGAQATNATDEVIKAAASEAGSLIPEVVDRVAEGLATDHPEFIGPKIVQAFPGFTKKDDE